MYKDKFRPHRHHTQPSSYLAQALDALDEGELPVPPQDGDPPVAMGLYGGDVEQAEAQERNGRTSSVPAAEPAYVFEP